MFRRKYRKLKRRIYRLLSARHDRPLPVATAEENALAEELRATFREMLNPEREADFSSEEEWLSNVNRLRELVLNVNKVLTHDMLLRKVWGPEYTEEREYLRVFIGRLRKIFESDPQNPTLILTVPGVGYSFKGT